MKYINGVMLDPSRLLERREVYKQLIPLIADYGYNTIFWHFTDDHGCMLKFPSHPELASRNAYTVKEMKAFIALAEKHGLQVIPELECFGHAGYITSKKRYAHLADGAGKAAYGAITPFHKDTKKILSDLIKDCAEIFNSPYIHAGLDEVGFGDNPSSKRYLKKRKKWQAFADHTNWLHQEITKNNKQMMMWGDHIVEYTNMDHGVDSEALDPRIADLISTDIIICDWHYDADVTNQSLAFLKKKKFKAIACPASMAHGSMTHPCKRNLDNIKQYAKVARQKSNTHLVGMMNTVWCPFRYFTGTTLYAMAYAAQLQTGKTERHVSELFLKTTFGIKNKSLAQAFENVHQVMPDLRQHYRLLAANSKELEGWVFKELGPDQKKSLSAAIKIVLAHKDKPKKNKGLYTDIAVSLQILSESINRYEDMQDIIQAGKNIKKELKSNPHEAKKHLRKNVKSLQSIYKAASKHRKLAEQRWHKTRFWDDPKRTGKHKHYRYHDSIMQRLYNHEAFIQKILQENLSLMR